MRLIDADALTIQVLKKAMDDAFLNGNTDMHRLLIQVIAHQPTIDAVPVIRCKDCKHFESNHIEKVNGIPLIVAHEICKRWGDGCKTSENGWCFMAERKEE